MQASARHIPTILAFALVGLVLSGCGTINEKLAAGAGDFIPQWAGGLPPDAPPRRGTPQYDEYMKEQERKRLQPAADANAAAPAPNSPAAATTPATALDPVH